MGVGSDWKLSMSPSFNHRSCHGLVTPHMSLLRTLKERTVKKVAQSHTEYQVLFGHTLRLPLSEQHQPHPSYLGEAWASLTDPRITHMDDTKAMGSAWEMQTPGAKLTRL